MRGLTRYVLYEFTFVFLIALVGMTLLMVVLGLVHEAMQQGLGVGPILRLIPYILPNALRFSVPGTILFAACMVYGRMSGANEIVAIKSLGISPMSVLWPALSMAFVLSLVAVWLNDLAVSWGRQGVQRVVLQSVEEIAYSMLKTKRSYSTKRFAINVRDVEDRTLIQPIVTFHGAGDTPQISITAETAEMRTSVDEDSLVIVMTNGMIEVGDRVSMIFPDTIERAIPLTEASRKGSRARGPSQLPLRSFTEEVSKQRVTIADLERSMAAEAGFEMLAGDMAGLTGDAWKSRQSGYMVASERLHRLRAEPYRRWANGFSCFCFVIVGAPLAVRLRNSDFMSTFGMCFLPILICYYPLLMFAVDRAKVGAVPPIGVWLGNVVLCLVGCWQMRRIIRY